MTEAPTRLPLVSVALVSGAVLGLEILLTRAFAIVHWHHFAYMIVSLALLGFGASGTFLALTHRSLVPRIATAYPVSLAAFGVLICVTPLLAERIPLQVEALLWDPWQPLWLLLLYLLLAAPFFCAATALGLALTTFRAAGGRVYAADLLGAGLGSLVTLIGLVYLPPESLLRVLAALGVWTAVVGAAELRGPVVRWAAVSVVAAAAAALAPPEWIRFDAGPYKGLSRALNVVGSRVLVERSSPLGRITVVANDQVPLRHAPGLSIAATAEPPPQLAVFTDGDAMDVITAARPDDTDASYLRATTGALAYRVAPPRSVLVLEAGGGLELLRARALGAEQIDALELNAAIARLLRQDFADFSGGLVQQPGVHLHVGEARGWLSSTDRYYDLIVMPASGGRGAAGLAGLTEDYARTTEALQLYLEHLAPGGFLSVSGTIQLPPRHGLKIVGIARAALETQGVADASHQLLMIRSWQTWTLLIKRERLTPAEIATARAFAAAHSFDLVWHPGLERAEANVYNQLREPWFYDGVSALLGAEHARFVHRYAFDIGIATDDRPYFQNFFRWPLLIEVLDTRKRGGMALLEAGYLLLAAVVVQATLAGVVLILLPLVLRAPVGQLAAATRWRTFGYFGALGLAFLFVEIAFLQKLILLVHHPTVAFGLTLATFLVGAGIGSAWSNRRPLARTRRTLQIAAIAITVFAAANVLLLGAIADQLAPWPVTARAGLALALLLPLAFWMGVPLPLVLRQLDEALVPWAWGINGCASVVSAALAALLAVELGFTRLLAIAVGLYLLVPFLAPSSGRPLRSRPESQVVRAAPS